MAMTNAEKQRAYRARKAAEREAAKAASGNGGDTPPPTTMRDAVDEALAHMKWLVPSDLASRAQARELARDIDLLTHAGDTAKALSAHRALSRVLNDLGGTPLVRLQRELRSLKHAKAEGEGERNEGEGGQGQPGNVTKFERPAKRSS
jgi:hypothetical protein